MNRVKVPVAPATKTIEEEANPNKEKLGWIAKVRTFDGDIKSFKSRIKTIEERQQEIIESANEYDAIVEAQVQLETAKANLKRHLSNNKEWVNLTEDLADEKLSLKDAQENMSDFLLGYFADTREKQIDLGPGQGRELVVKARLGKEKDYQTNLFSPQPTITEVTDGRA